MNQAITESLRSGLTYVSNNVRVGRGYVDFDAGISSTNGAFARAEAGYRLRENLSVFGFGELDHLATSDFSAMAGVGLRLTF